MSKSDDLRRAAYECQALGACDSGQWDGVVIPAAKEAATKHSRIFDARACMDPSDRYEPPRRTILRDDQVVVDANVLLAAEARIKEMEAKLQWLDERGVLADAIRAYAAECADRIKRCLDGVAQS